MRRSDRFTVSISSAISVWLLLAIVYSTPAFSADSADACRSISPSALDSYTNEIASALKWATEDARNNGTAGQYAVAATNSRDLLQRAHQSAAASASALRNADPSTTSYGEAGETKEHIRAILEIVPQAAHWSVISSIYHSSVAAENAFDESVGILERGNALFADARRCYMGLSSEQTTPNSSQSAVPVPAPLFHFSLDGPDIDGDAKLYVKKGSSAPTTVPGPTGGALYFTDASAVAAPFNLNSAQYPQTTVTAWVKRDGESDGGRTILSGGDGAGILLGVNATQLTVKAGPTGVSFNENMPTDEWVFVAAVVDTENGWARLHQNDGIYRKDGIKKTGLGKSPKRYANPDNAEADEEAYLFVGASQFRSWGRSEASLAIDDVRVYAGALTVDQISIIRDETGPTAIGETEKNDPTRLPGDQFDGETPIDNLPQSALPGVDVSGTLPTREIETRSTNEILQDRVNQTRPPEITYSSEEEAQAAAEERAREREQAENDRQESGQSSDSNGYALSSVTQRTAVAGIPGTTALPIDLVDNVVETIQLLYPDGEDDSGPVEVLIGGSSGRVVSSDSGAGLPAKISVGRRKAMVGTVRACIGANTLKGLQIEGNDLDNDGKFGEYYKIADDSGNCKWLERRRCRDLNAAATGVVVHLYQNPKYDKKQVVGIQLICRLVVPN